MICKYCGKENSDSVLFCCDCGTKAGCDAPEIVVPEKSGFKLKLFKDRYCAKCGKKAGLLTRTKLADGNYICADCEPSLPGYLSNYLDKGSYLSQKDIEDYDVLCRCIERSKELEEVFELTHYYGSIMVDANHGIFYIKEGAFRTPLYLELKDLLLFDLTFVPTEYKEGILSEKVVGDVTATVATAVPSMCVAITAAKNVKGKAKSHILSNKIDYEDPKDMQEFLYNFAAIWEMYQPKYQDEEASGSSASELQKAMALFMLDDISGVDLAKLKEMRNRLIMTFHPDMGDSADTKYAQKINAAFEILKAEIEK